MPKSRPPYAPEVRRQLVALVRSGRDPEELARQFEPTAQSIRNWVAQADRDAGQRHDGLTTEEREELRKLRREVKTLREERELFAGIDHLTGLFDGHGRVFVAVNDYPGDVSDRFQLWS